VRMYVCVCVCGVCAHVCLYVSASHTVETATRHLFLMLSSSPLLSLSSLSLSIVSASRGEGAMFAFAVRSLSSVNPMWSESFITLSTTPVGLIRFTS
jgi:hypothetical protein